MSKFIRVTMNLTEKDVKTAKRLKKLLNVKTKADVVSASLAITEALIRNREYTQSRD